MNKIRTYEDLLAEKLELEKLLVVQKEIVRRDMAALKEELKPAADALRFVGKFTTKDRTNSLLNLGVDLVGDVVLKNFVLAKTGWVTKLILPYFAKNLGSNLLSSKTSGFLGNLIQKFSKNAA